MSAVSSPCMTFVGGAGTVTGSKTLIETRRGRLLVDCGLHQGNRQLRKRNWDAFPVEPRSIDAVLLTHAHIDHCGYLPRLWREGFRGTVFCTLDTHRLAQIVLPDSGHLHEEEAAHANRVGSSKHDPALPLYTEADARSCLELFAPVDFDTRTEVVPDVSATWSRAGHILGAALIDIELKESMKHVVFSGDVGRSDHPLLEPPARLPAANLLVLESTYGDRIGARDDVGTIIADEVNGAVQRSGVVIIPAFAVDRTEMVLWSLDQLLERGLIPNLPVFVDSPMALQTLDVYRAAALSGSPAVRPELRGRNLFGSIDLREAKTAEQSKQINERLGPMIIISASGMASGGRVLHHLAQRIGDARNSVLLVGFQAPGTRGDMLRRGVRRIKIFGRSHAVRARVASIGLSAHAHADELATWVANAPSAPGVVYLNHGEHPAAASLARRLRGDGLPVEVAARGHRVAI